MTQSTDVRRRRIVLGGAALTGAGVLTGWMRWNPVRAAVADTLAPAGQVTIVAFDDHGRRLGKRSVERVVKTVAEWKAALTAEQFYILRKRGTERPFSGRYVDKPKQAGIYRCQGCGNALYSAATQFHSGTGWPSFWQPIAAQNVTEDVDRRLGIARAEVRCTLCNGHLGHKFHDGPEPTGLRYCMDSIALRFVATGAA